MDHGAEIGAFLITHAGGGACPRAGNDAAADFMCQTHSRCQISKPCRFVLGFHAMVAASLCVLCLCVCAC